MLHETENGFMKNNEMLCILFFTAGVDSGCALNYGLNMWIGKQ